MKRVMCLIVFVSCFFGFSITAFASDVTVQFEDETVRLESAPLVKNATTMVPMREIFETLGATVYYVPQDQSIVAKKGYNIVKLTIGQHYAYVDNNVVGLLIAPEIFNGRTYVPLRFVGESFGYKVSWNPQTKVIKIYSQETEDQPTEEVKPDPDSRINWTVKFSKKFYGDAVEDNEGNVIVPNGNALYKYAPDGKQLWMQVLGYEGDIEEEDQHVGTPFVDDEGNIYVLTSDYLKGGNLTTNIIKLDKDGNIEFNHDKYSSRYAMDKFPGDIKIIGGKVFYIVKNTLYVMKKDSMPDWQYTSNEPMEVLPVEVDNDRIAFVDNNKFMVYDLKGNEKWRKSLSIGNVKSVVQDNNRKMAYVMHMPKNSGEKILINAIDLLTKEWRWQFSEAADSAKQPLLDKAGNLILATNKGIIKLNANGQVEWRIKTLIPAAWASDNIENLLYVATEDNKIVCISAETGSALWQEQLDSKVVSLTVASSVLFAQNENGEFLSIKK